MKNITENRFYVYIYLDPRKPGTYTYGELLFDYEPFYVGKGTGDRKHEHIRSIKSSKHSYKNNKIKKIIEETQSKPIIITYFKNLFETDAYEFEKKLITIIGRNDLKQGPLTNLTDGGDGPVGMICLPETREKISENVKGEKNPMYGKNHSEESKQNISTTRKEKIKKGEIIPAKHSEEWKEKLRNENYFAKNVDDESIIRLNKEGKTNIEISNETGITLRIIYNRLKKYGLTRNRNSNDKFLLDIDVIQTLILDGLSYNEIATILKVSESCVGRNYRKSKYYSGSRSKWDNIKNRF